MRAPTYCASLAARMPRLTVITHEQNRGYGGALRSGFTAATKELVFYTDGDGQYDVRELPVLLMLLTDDTDFVNGIKMTRQDPAYRVHAGNIHRFCHAVAVLAAHPRRRLRLPVDSPPRPGGRASCAAPAGRSASSSSNMPSGPGPDSAKCRSTTTRASGVSRSSSSLDGSFRPICTSPPSGSS